MQKGESNSSTTKRVPLHTKADGAAAYTLLGSSGNPTAGTSRCQADCHFHARSVSWIGDFPVGRRYRAKFTTYRRLNRSPRPARHFRIDSYRSQDLATRGTVFRPPLPQICQSRGDSLYQQADFAARTHATGTARRTGCERSRRARLMALVSGKAPCVARIPYSFPHVC